MGLSDYNENVIMRPCIGAFAITPDDNTDLPRQTRGIYVGVTGNLKVTLVDGSIVTFDLLAAGVVHPFQAKRVFSADTTALSIIGLY